MEDVDRTRLDDLVTITTDLVSAYVSNNHVRAAELPELIATTHAALAGLGAPAASAEPAPEKPSPAQIKRSITPEGIVSFLDGKPYKTLKRHLTRHGLTPETYRARYGLPADYPVVAASYSAQRSSLAKSLGLGQGRRAAPEADGVEATAEGTAAEEIAPEEATDAAAEPEAEPAKPKRAPRARKAKAADA